MLGVNLYAEARQQGRLWTPRAFKSSDIHAWCDASNRAFVTMSGSAVSGVVGPASGVNGFGGVNSPTYSPNGTVTPYAPNMITLNGANQTLDTSASGYNSTNGLSAFAAVLVSSFYNSATIFGYPQAPSDGSFDLRLIADGTLQLVRAKQLVLVSGGTSGVANSINICGGIAYSNFSGAYLNGAANENSTNPAFTQGIARIGSNGDIEFYSGRIGEAIIFLRKLTFLERAQVEGYLAWKWGAQNNLITSHLYKSRPPLLGV